VNDVPETLYKNPKTPLIASFFGEFNVINDKIVYANQLEVVEKSDLKVTVKRSYFKGHYYLIEADLDGETVFFEHHSKLEIGAVLHLKIEK
ncbi:MAG: ABC transporter ATP-binding protein, partial [Algibacter sp.]